MVLSMAGCGSSSNSTETTAAAAETTAAAADSSAAESKEATSNTDATVIKLGTTVNEQDSFQVCAEKFAELVKERTNGAYEIEIHPNGALGDERLQRYGCSRYAVPVRKQRGSLQSPRR